MGIVLRFPRHARASTGSRAAKATKCSGFKPADCAMGVAKIAAHHSAGMELRSHHLRTASGLARMSEAISKRDDHSPTTSMKDSGSLDMPGMIVQSVLLRKSEMSYDFKNELLDNRSMDRMTETEETLAFICRTRDAREAKFTTQKPVYKFLGVEQSHYKHWETKRPMPRRYIPKFCIICEVSMEWLLTGEGNGPDVTLAPPKVTKRASKRPRARAA